MVVMEVSNQDSLPIRAIAVITMNDLNDRISEGRSKRRFTKFGRSTRGPLVVSTYSDLLL
jgi:hypothetical protein